MTFEQILGVVILLAPVVVWAVASVFFKPRREDGAPERIVGGL